MGTTRSQAQSVGRRSLMARAAVTGSTSPIKPRPRTRVLLVLGAAVGLTGAAQGLHPDALTAGPTWTSVEHGEMAYSMPIAELSKKQGKRFAAGREAFNEAWVVAPDPGVWGLGPTFNEDRCSHCHEANGRSPVLPDGGEAVRGPLVRLSIAGKDESGAPLPHPAYGDQFQNRGIEGRVPPEGKVIINYTSREVQLAGGEFVTLQEPNIEFAELQFGEMGENTMTSLRVAPQLVGLGLLEMQS